jgi:hypothetical protein
VVTSAREAATSPSADAIDWTFHALTGILPMPMVCTVLVASKMVALTPSGTNWMLCDQRLYNRPKANAMSGQWGGHIAQFGLAAVSQRN